MHILTKTDTGVEKKKNINRYGAGFVPMDESLAEVFVDVSGRPFLNYSVKLNKSTKKGDFDYSLVEEFFRALAMHARITLHINLRYGKNNHHIAEGIFKGLGKALGAAVKVQGADVPSTKGTL